MELDIPAILSTLSVIITAWFTYNQYTKDKMTDFKIEKLKKEEEERDYNMEMEKPRYGRNMILLK